MSRAKWLIVLLIVIVVATLVTVAAMPRAPSKAGKESPMLLGVHEQYQGDNATTPSETLTRYPRAMVTREFKGGIVKPQNLVKSTLNLCQEVWDAGLVCNVSFKLSPAEVANGEWQIYVQQLCRFLVDNGRTGKTVLTFWHEPEDDSADSFPNGRKSGKAVSFDTADEFVTYFDTIHDWCKAVSPSVMTSHAALGYAYRPTIGGKGDKSAYVTNADAWRTKADINAIDIYSGRSFPLDMTLGTSGAFKRWRDSHGGPWGVSERGWTAPPDKHDERAASILAEGEWLASLPDSERPVFYIVWLTEGVEGDDNLKPDDSMREAVNTVFDRLLTPTPTPEPTPDPTDQECPLCHGTGRVPADRDITINTTVTVTNAR